MSMDHPKMSRIMLLLLAVLIAVLPCVTVALASDGELPWLIPGTWHYMADEELAVMALNLDGTVALHSNAVAGNGAWTYEGTWELEILAEWSEEFGENDRLTLQFTATDNPKYEGSAYSVTCVYSVYAESWVEDSTRNTVLIRTLVSADGATPFMDLCEEEDYADLVKKEAPNMQVVNCKSFVSLREERSTKSARLAKVPLKALVFAFPEEAEQDGFIRCVYGDEYGYILAEYLQPVE